MRTDMVRRARRLFLAVIVLSFAAGGVFFWQGARLGGGPLWLRQLAGVPVAIAYKHIGIIAGHGGNDSGTVCIDGLTEAEVNQKVAAMVARDLSRRGATVDILKEFDVRLRGYTADALVSIHADSCKADYRFTGFKVASQAGGSAESARLASCLHKTYADATRLPFSENTITDDMRDYHAFREIAATTPGAIIETGFLNTDRKMLTEHTDRVAAGIVNGIECFLVPLSNQ